ncbi:MAG TPA: DUF983 domain-containing protein [Anaerolineae bacterium]|nr:DUF983 domain-containing protein [Anaerolineae bacterium]
MSDDKEKTVMKRLVAVVRGRCPHCLEGVVFEHWWQMAEHCEVCGIDFEREHGFFMMSIFFGYVLGFFVVLPFCLWLYWQGATIMWYVVVATIVLLLASPWIFQYSRLIWLHVDELLDPRRD